ncbi:hypothetical protein Tco_1042162 [Tanacetum coccineum]|uniref:Uncharacterized protein n=1 Tax=Tanacetum coccineum TaxID=301880 RepID=A0ABQ5GI87_9ASTR
MVKPVWNNALRVNHQKFAKKTHPCAKKNMVPKAVLMKSGLVSINIARQNISKTAVLVNTARQVNTSHSKPTVNAAKPMSYLSKTTHSTVKRPIHKNTTFKNSNINQRVNTVRDKNVNTARSKAVVNVVKGNNVNVVKASACWVWKPRLKFRPCFLNTTEASNHPKEDLIILCNKADPRQPQMDLQNQGVIDRDLKEQTGNMYKSSDNAGQARKETRTCQGLHLTNHYDNCRPYFPRIQKRFLMMMNSKPSSDNGKKVDEDLRKESKKKQALNFQMIQICLLWKIIHIFDDKDDGLKADMNNLDTTIQVSPIPTTRIHKDHP